MKIVVTGNSVRWTLFWVQRALLAGAVVLFGYCAFILADGWMFQNRESRQFEQLRKAEQATPAMVIRAADRALIGRIEIPRLGLSVMIMEGTSGATLRRAVGHIAGTALPGQPGNIGLSGHRDTFFRPLKNIRKGDTVTLTTLAGEYRYRVVSTSVVEPSAVAVLAPGANEVLTLVTCYPFYFVGPAPSRFIVRAERIL